MEKLALSPFHSGTRVNCYAKIIIKLSLQVTPLPLLFLQQQLPDISLANNITHYTEQSLG